MLPAASDISRLSRAIESGIILHRSGEEQKGTTGRRLASQGRDGTTATQNSPGVVPVSQGCEAAPSGPGNGGQAALRHDGILSAADSRAKAATACWCSSALLPLPFPPFALHPQTQKHSSPGLSPAACSSPGFVAQCKALQPCWQKSMCSKWPLTQQCPPLRNRTTFRKTVHAWTLETTPSAPGSSEAAYHREKGSTRLLEGALPGCPRRGPQPACRVRCTLTRKIGSWVPSLQKDEH